MFFVPVTHLLVGPRPFKGMGVEAIVFGFRGPHLRFEFITTTPRTTLEVVKSKGTVQQLSLIEPRSMNRSETRPPPAMTFVEKTLGRCSGVAGVTIMDQIDPFQPTVLAAEDRQGRREMKRVLFFQKHHSHLPRMNDQQHQHVDCPMPSIVELLLLDRTRNGP